jgi:hypothetical protein
MPALDDGALMLALVAKDKTQNPINFLYIYSKMAASMSEKNAVLKKRREVPTGSQQR